MTSPNLCAIFTSVTTTDIACLFAAGSLSLFAFKPLTGTLKPQSNGLLYSNTVIGTPAVDGWATPSPLLAVPSITAHPSTAGVPTLHY